MGDALSLGSQQDAAADEMTEGRFVPPGFERALALTRDFYAWEQRGRGWQVWPEPVELEPPFDVPPHLSSV